MTVDLIQGSTEWHAARLGKLTASRFADAIAKTRTGWGASRANYMAELIAERLTGVPAETYTNSIMQRGRDLEPEARAAYCFHADVDVVEVGFIAHPTIAESGASPDGLVGGDGLVEFKCPNTSTHLDTLLGTPIAEKYIVQAMWQMACAQRQWCDWCSYDPRLPEAMRLYVYRIARDDELIASLEADARTFLADLDDKVKRLTERYTMQRAA